MATLVFTLLLCLFIVPQMVDAQVQRHECGTKCESRCSKSRKPKMCLKTCTACSNTCEGSVPPDSTANKEVCPCYARYKKGRCP